MPRKARFRFGFNALGDGYSGMDHRNKGLPEGSEGDPWKLWDQAFVAARSGDFLLMENVVNLYDPLGNYTLNRQCMTLIGDAGTSACFRPIIGELENPTRPYDYDSATDYAHAVAGRGRLGDVPVLFAAFRRYREVPDAEIIRVLVDRLLEREPGGLPDPAELEDFSVYESAVNAAYGELEARFGRDAHVFRGELLDVRRLAERLLEALQRPYFSMSWRHRFEASTGTDCSGFYKRGELQPLAAAAIVEDFLESGAAERFEPGVRYFFGHRIPD